MGQIMSLMLVPGGTPADEEPPPAPDYADPASWVALPDREDKVDLVPSATSEQDRQATAEVDLFYLHPTTYYKKERWHAPYDDPWASRFVDELVASGQASAFNGCARIFGPRYRQASIGAYFVDPERSRAAFELAYRDIERAFTYYLEHHNRGRPFILASHSQGTMHAIRLLETIDRSPLRRQLVAAYLVGYRFPLDKLERSYHHIGICHTADQTGCVVGWDTYSTRIQQDPPLHAFHWYGDRLETVIGDTVSRPVLCTNPLTWRDDEELAPASLHLGALPPTTDRKMPSLFRIIMGARPEELSVSRLAAPVPRLTGARCQNGKLNIPPVEEKAFADMEMGGSYHTLDYALFYMNIRRNAEERVAAYLAVHPSLTSSTTRPGRDPSPH